MAMTLAPLSDERHADRDTPGNRMARRWIVCPNGKKIEGANYCYLIHFAISAHIERWGLIIHGGRREKQRIHRLRRGDSYSSRRR